MTSNIFFMKFDEKTYGTEYVWMLRAVLRTLKNLNYDNFKIYVHDNTAKDFFQYLAISYGNHTIDQYQNSIKQGLDTVGIWEGYPFYIDNSISPGTYKIGYLTKS